MKNRLMNQAKERKDKLTTAQEVCNKYKSQITSKTTLEEFKNLLRTESVFKLLRPKDQEKIYNDIIEPLKKSEKEGSFKNNSIFKI